MDANAHAVAVPCAMLVHHACRVLLYLALCLLMFGCSDDAGAGASDADETADGTADGTAGDETGAGALTRGILRWMRRRRPLHGGHLRGERQLRVRTHPRQRTCRPIIEVTYPPRGATVVVEPGQTELTVTGTVSSGLGTITSSPSTRSPWRSPPTAPSATRSPFNTAEISSGSPPPTTPATSVAAYRASSRPRISGSPPPAARG